MKNLILLQKGKCTSTLYNRDGLLIETSLSYAIHNRMCFENGNLLVKQNVKGLRTEKGFNQEIWGRVTIINRLIADLRNKRDVQSLEETRSSNNVCMKPSIKHVNLNFANYASWQAICSMQPYLGSGGGEAPYPMMEEPIITAILQDCHSETESYKFPLTQRAYVDV